MSGPTFITTLALSAWFVLAALAGGEGWLVGLPRPVLLCIGPALCALVLLAVFSIAPVRRLAWSLPLRLMIGVHGARIVGASFLVLHARMQLPGVLAIPAGWAEILIVAAALILATLPMRRGLWLRLARWWNWAGIVELALLWIGGAILALNFPDRAFAYARPPLSLHLTFLSPLAIAFHCILLGRLQFSVQDPAAEDASG